MVNLALAREIVETVVFRPFQGSMADVPVDYYNAEQGQSTAFEYIADSLAWMMVRGAVDTIHQVMYRVKRSRDPMDNGTGFPTIRLILLTLHITLLVFPVSSQNDGPTGLSIDCGSETNYTDENKILWVTDAGYVSTGKNVNHLLVYSNKTITNGNQSQSLRYFDEGRGRDCYVLPVQHQFTYLVRLTFYYGDWNSPENFTRFNVYLNGNNWLNFLFEKGNDYHETYTYEALVYMTSTTLDVCLVRDQGTPFISSLELRMLASGMYLTVVGNNKYMGLFTRVNAGAFTYSGAYLRFPEDEYDRLWYTPETYGNITTIRFINGSSNAYGPSNGQSSRTNLTVNPSLTPERPPEKTMEDAWVADSSSSTISYTAVSNGPIGPTSVYGYFQEVAYPWFPREMNFSVNEFLLDTFNTSDQPYEVRSYILDVQENFVTITVKTSEIGFPPLINTFEIYFVYDWNASTTSDQEVELITSVRNLLNLTDWTGDPCVPVPYDWLRCSVFNDDQSQSTSNNNQTRTNSVIQAAMNVTGMSLADIATIETVPGEISNLSALTFLNLSNTSLMNISSSSFSGLSNLSVLDVSHNRLTGGVLKFVQTINNRNLQELYVTNNSLEGDFPLDQLLAEFPKLQDALFDSNIKISGNLNLTSWYTYMISQSLKSGNSTAKAAVTEAASKSSTFPSISLTNNNVIDVIPSFDVLTPVITSYLSYLQTSQIMPSNNISGVLLGGNPFCKQSTSNDGLHVTARSFLCRNSTSDSVALVSTDPSTKSKIGAIIGGVIGGVAGLVACVLFAVVWWLRKQNSSLKQIQEAWARQKVQPRIYSYSDLRRATSNFSSEQKLGQGTFGAVYKGQVIDSEDGTVELVAVKELFASKQALPEFLNEAVLITGIKHRNLVQLKGCCIDSPKEQRFLVYEFAENGNLAEALWDTAGSRDLEGKNLSPTLDWQLRLKVCVGIARGLSYLHEELQPRIIHRDIKPANILLDKQFNAKIADFGLARSILEDQTQADFTSVAGTQGYFSPEYATQGQLTEKADVFAFGVVLLEIVAGRKTVDRFLSEEKQYLQSWARELKNEGRLLDLLDPKLETTANVKEVMRVINLAFLCLEFYPEMRPTMSEAVTMLQGIMDVTLYRPESGEDSHGFQQGDYMKLWPTLLDLNDEYPSASLSNSDNSNTDVELSTLSGR